jgi:hypothetical protein
MKRISFDKCFLNAERNNLVKNKIHTIRQNFDYWKKFEGRDVELFTWEGKPYRSKQKVFCVKRIYSVQSVILSEGGLVYNIDDEWGICPWDLIWHITDSMAKNDGLTPEEFRAWFADYPEDEMAILHFTDFRY